MGQIATDDNMSFLESLVVACRTAHMVNDIPQIYLAAPMYDRLEQLEGPLPDNFVKIGPYNA